MRGEHEPQHKHYHWLKDKDFVRVERSERNKYLEAVQRIGHFPKGWVRVGGLLKEFYE